MKQKTLFTLLGIWFFVAIWITFQQEIISGGALSTNSWVRLLILGYFSLSALWFYKKGQNLQIKNPRKVFIIWASINAMAVEIFHMISNPLDSSLIITLQTPFLEALKKIGIDLALTLPAYITIFYVIWWFAKRYNYSPFAFFFVMSLGQALGDGQAYFRIYPGMLLFLPYIMLNYWAINFVPYLTVKKSIKLEKTEENLFIKYILPVVVMIITYFFVASIIINLGRALGWLPPLPLIN